MAFLDYAGLDSFRQKLMSTLVPQSRKINGKPLTSDINLAASDISGLNAGETVFFQSGYYRGTGNYGSSNPNRLTFSFAPKLVMIPFVCEGNGSELRFQPFSDYLWAFNPSELKVSYERFKGFFKSGSEDSYAKRSYDSKTVYWYNVENANAQLNGSNYTYFYYAIG